VSAFQVMTAKPGDVDADNRLSIDWAGSLYISDASSSIVVHGTKDEVQTEIAYLRVALQMAANNVALWEK
jgi:hypothetical protein